MLRKFFIKRFRTYAIIMIIPLLVLFLIMGYLILETQQRELEKQGVNTLKSINDNIVYVAYSTIHQQDMMMGIAQYKLSIQKLFNHSELEYQDVIFLNAAKSFLRSFESAYPYINSIYFYLDGRNNYLTSSSEQLVSLQTFYDKAWFEKYSKMSEEEKQFVETRWIKRYQYEEAKKVITIYQKMTSANGVIVVNINSENFGEMIRSMLYHSGQSFFYLNDRGDVLFSSDEQSAMDVEKEKDFFQKMIKAYQLDGEFKSNQKWVKVNGKYYLFCIKPADYFDTYFVSLITFDTFKDKMLNYLQIAVSILIVNLSLIMLLAWIITKIAFKHITSLVELFGAAERGETVEKPQTIVKDEYNLIMNNILFLFIKNNQMQTHLLEKQHQNEISELKALQMQINPHFIFNTLQTMDLEVLKELGGLSTLHTMIQELSRIIKYALNDPTELVTLKEELDYLKAYMQIQEIRFKNKIVTYFEIEENVLDYQVFRLMLQPIVENSVNHGYTSINERFYIKIKIFGRKNNMYVSIIDSGCGMTKEEIQKLYLRINDIKAKNIGLTNLNRRLVLHYGEYSKIHIRSKKGMGTEISFKIPIQALVNKSKDNKE
ncbi:sensor histidine kinase [Cellulosilyticum sp. I15G10I2]|uniref:sensor histidine kinase n=1 Tax=Cellulosilyticum sp. I15G10I2 TaxID=1892843 RepID=UPI00085BF9B5|nr:histidine kinase [Cellulosilyticum sp. I15G10I2]